MPTLVWDQVGSRIYEAGLDKGVLFLPNGSAVPWNGLVSVSEKTDRSSSPVYFDGMKINDLVVVGDFSGTLKAITYPDEFVELEGFISPRRGMYVGEQQPKSFGLCYRSLVESDVEGISGYKIHILYNVFAIPSDQTYSTLSNSTDPTEFSWELVAIPEPVTDFRPTAHVVIDSRIFDPLLLQELENLLYGTETTAPTLLPLRDLIDFLDTWYSIEIFDNHDGSWTATTPHDELITDNGDGSFTITGVDGTYLDADTYRISTTIDAP